MSNGSGESVQAKPAILDLTRSYKNVTNEVSRSDRMTTMKNHFSSFRPAWAVTVRLAVLGVAFSTLAFGQGQESRPRDSKPCRRIPTDHQISARALSLPTGHNLLPFHLPLPVAFSKKKAT